MLPTSAHVVSVVDEILPSLSSGKILVDMSSGAPAATQKIAADLGVIGVSVVDAPVSGGVSRAVTGELAIMTGHESAQQPGFGRRIFDGGRSPGDRTAVRP
jgi:3-hydroxyisobutyrate dehydrogenase